MPVRYLLYLTLFFLLLCPFSVADDLKKEAADSENITGTPLESIRAEDIKKHLSFLASDALEGREAGSRGGNAAGAYIVNQLRKHDRFKPAGQDDYFQYFGNDFRNILIELKGTDPVLKKEIVLIGGHYDHVGFGNRYNSRGPIGQIHNGADDNASGTSLLLDLAEAFQLTPYKGKRTLLIAFWDAEEKGLLGSRHWTDNPTRPLNNIKLVLNIDMIGRLQKKPMKVIGVRSGLGLRKFLSGQSSGLPVSLEFDWIMDPNSDHHPFFMKKIPVAFFHTRKHEDYHRPSDDVDKVDLKGIRNQGQYFYQLITAAVNEEKLPEFRPESIQESYKKYEPVHSVPKYSESRLGISWELSPDKKREVKIKKVYSGTPAELSGLQSGDEILTFGGYSVKESEDFRQIVNTVEKSIKAEIRKAGTDEIISISLALNGEPQKVGINWILDDAEPESIILNAVTSGSAADLAGLKKGDRIYQLGNQPVRQIPSLEDFFQNTEGELPVRFEHLGQIKESALKFLPKPKETEPVSEPATESASGS